MSILATCRVCGYECRDDGHLPPAYALEVAEHHHWRLYGRPDTYLEFLSLRALVLRLRNLRETAA